MEGRSFGNYRRGSGDRGRGRNVGRGRNNYDQNYQSQYNESGGRGRWGRGPHAEVSDYSGSPQRRSHALVYNYRAPQQQSSHAFGEPDQQSSHAGGYSYGAPQQQSGSGGRPWGPSSSSSSMIGQPRSQGRWQSQNQTERPHQSPPPSPSADSVGLNIQSLNISEQKQLLSSPEKTEDKILPLRRPDRGGTLAVKTVSLLVNHFLVRFNPRCTIMHYNVDVKQDTPAGNQSFKKSIPKPILRLVKDQLFSDESMDFAADMDAYDGEKNIFSAVKLPVGEFNVNLSDGGEDAGVCSYKITINEVNQLKLSKLKDYLGGNLLHIPRVILQCMDLVMKENPSKCRITVDRSFYSQNYRPGDDLQCGVAIHRGFRQSLIATSQGVVLCLDCSVLAMHKPLPVLDFLKENIENFKGVDDVIRLKGEVSSVLKGLKVRVTHRITKQKYTIKGLSDEPTLKLSFDHVDPDSQAAPRKVRIVDYFWQKYEKRIDYLDIPCLDLGNANKKNFVPMEFCVLVEGQRYPKEHLDPDRARFLKNISLAVPAERKSSICEMVKAEDGPCGIVAKNFDMKVEEKMTSVQGRVLGAPELKLRAANGDVCPVRVDQEKCHWNLVGKSVVEGQRVEHWALIDFTANGHPKLRTQEFIDKLRNCSLRLGMHIEYPLCCQLTGMHEFSSVSTIEKLLRKVIADARKKGGLQIIVCVMTRKDPGYKYLKWISETQIGVVTQCCLSGNVNKGQDQYLANLCLKINAKVGGSNVELIERLPHFVDEDNVMFIGADVNHPAARNTTCPSIAAVVGTINWPAANRYAARVQPQECRKEKIVNFGSICRDLVNTFAQLNNSRPKKIIVFRDGVSEGQFDMVLNEELRDLMEAIYDEHYRPTITLVVAQKRHHTRLFTLRRDGGVGGNVPPGTVVDTKIVHPFEFDFYLCSHYGSLGTSKPTHYYVLWDQNKFRSDELQKLIYNLCFTYARCTKPVSLVPPIYYADLVAYRGRLFQEVEMEQSPASLISSATSSKSLSSSSASFDQNFYTLHRDLQNVMFFV